MQVTVNRKELVKSLEQVKRTEFKGKRKDVTVRLTACDGCVFIAANCMVKATEALVMEEGACDVRLMMLMKFMESYHDRENIRIEADHQHLIIETTKMVSVNYSSTPSNPSGFTPAPSVDNSAILDGLNRRKTHNPDSKGEDYGS